MPSTILLLPLSCSFKLHIFLCSFHVVFDLPSSLYDDPLTLLGLLLPAQKVERDKVWLKIRTNKQIARKFNSLLSCVGFTFVHMILDKGKNSSKLIPLCCLFALRLQSMQLAAKYHHWQMKLGVAERNVFNLAQRFLPFRIQLSQSLPSMDFETN